jgi:DNA-binding transcriptional regulator YiaG
METPDQHPRTRALLAEFRAWCDRRHGRRTEAAEVLGVSPQTITDWFAFRKHPTGEQALHLQHLLRTKWRQR